MTGHFNDRPAAQAAAIILAAEGLVVVAILSAFVYVLVTL